MKKSNLKLIERFHTYDWDRLLDGSVWELKEGEDFRTLRSFRVSASIKSMSRGLRAVTRFDKNRGVLLFQAVKPT